MRLSACSIVKNEAKNIARSIESYKNVVDEIIIVDTGSTDNTVEICERLGAKVLHYPWNNDFAAAKNFALEHAKGDWIIFLDADEWFVPKLDDDRIFKVLDRVEKMDKNIGVIKTILCNVDEKTGFISSRNTSARIFRNAPDVRYAGKIHEDIYKDGKPIKPVTLEELEIYHSGYAKGRVIAKSVRNLEILNDIYSQGQADTATYFYLCRENSILGNYNEALKFYDLFFQQKDHEILIAIANIFVSIYEHGIIIKQNCLDKFTTEDIIESINLAIEKYPEIPKHYYLKGMQYLYIDYDEALIAFSKAIELHRKYKGPYINSFDHALSDCYFRIAQIYRAKNRTEKAFDYYVLSLKEQPLQEGAFGELIQLIRNQPNEEIILFLNSIYDNNNVDHVEFLAKQLMMTRLHLVFLYYAMKYNKEFNGQDETTYIAMILANKEEEAVNTAMAAYFNAGKEEDRFFATLAILCKKRQDLFEQYKSSLNPHFSSILNKYLNGGKLRNPSNEEVNAFLRLYRYLFYFGSVTDIEEFEGLFEEMPLVVMASIIEQHVSYKDHSLIIDKALSFLTKVKSEHFKTQMHKTLGFSYFSIRDYAQSVEHFQNALESKHVDIDRNIIIYLKSICEIETNELIRFKAQKLYDCYEPIFTDYVEVNDILRTGKIVDNSSEKDLYKISIMDEVTFQKVTEAEDVKLPDLVMNAYYALLEKYIENDLDVCAHNVILRLLKYGHKKKDILYFRLGEIYTRFHNPQMSLYCHNKAFAENAIFAATLITDPTNSNQNYIYKPTTYNKLEHCPLCGATAPLEAIYNALVSPDFSSEYPPLKIWHYCPKCRHMYTEDYVAEVSLNVEEKKAKEAVKNMALNMQGYDELIQDLAKLAPGKKLLDIGSGNGQFLAAASEHGFDSIGIEPSKNLANISSKVLDITVHNCRFEDFISPESYDVIAMGLVLEGMIDPQGVVNSVYKLLNEEGLLYIETPNFESGYAKVMKDKCPELRSSRVINYFSRYSLEMLLNNCGFEVLSYHMSKRNHGYMEVIARKQGEVTRV